MTMANDLISVLNDDFNYLAHYGVTGMHPRTHIYGKYQNQAVYARGNPKYGSVAKRAFGKVTGIDDEQRKIIKNITNDTKALKSEAKRVEKAAKADLKSIKHEKKAAKIDYDIKKTDVAEQKRRVKAAKQNSDRRTANYEKLELLRAKQERDASKENLKSYKYRLQSAKADADQAKAYAKNLRNNSKSMKAGENDAIIDLGLTAGWGRMKRVANNYAYFTRHQDQAKSTISKAARYITPGRKIDQSYIDAYNATISNAFNMYNIGTVDKS